MSTNIMKKVAHEHQWTIVRLPPTFEDKWVCKICAAEMDMR